MENKEENPQPITEEQKEAATMIESLSEDILNKLRSGDTDVDVQLLMNAIETYASFPNYDKEAATRWKGRLEEITKLLEIQYKKVQDELQQIVKNNPKITAYDKASAIEEEDE